ncbi:MAG: hypothetical protein NC124_14870 [Clostridium sp.]|nr:hypothetical protein [Clostridium sp.]
MRTYFKDKVVLTVMFIWLFGIHIAFEIIYLQFINLDYTFCLYPVRFLIYLAFIHYPITHRIMTILEKYSSANVLLGFEKRIIDVYFIILFVSLFYCNKILLGLKWFCMILLIVYSINLVKHMQKELSVSNTDLDNGLTFQVTCIEYWILMVAICSFGNNILSQILSALFLAAGTILRGISLYDNQKTNGLLNHIVIKFVFAALIEWIAFILFFTGVPFETLHTFFAELYINKPTIYIDMLGLLIVCCLLEFPMHHIRNQLCKKV